MKNVIAITGCSMSHTRLDKSFTKMRQLGLQFKIKACPGPPGVWTQEVRVSNHLLKNCFTERKRLHFEIYKLKRKTKNASERGLEKGQFKLVARGLPDTARCQAYLALPTNLAKEEVARGLPDTARCQAYHCTTSSECARWEGNWLFVVVVVVDSQKVGTVSTKCTSCS